ncbi:hypothetical protein L3Q82_001554 [Scortum barcoo]|uniref:Uncharacterized protein n=1 Tax=Scortum barcoo TaxID=214431 RepID=A0ACB8W832_9TELE|nr:hypothetical protein L3Q82_001554 [Scortum barcoo]
MDTWTCSFDSSWVFHCRPIRLSYEWSALVFILLSSEKDLDVFDLKKYSASEEALLRLLPVVKASNKALLSGCNLSERSCEALSSFLSSQSSSLRELDLSNNKPAGFRSEAAVCWTEESTLHIGNSQSVRLSDHKRRLCFSGLSSDLQPLPSERAGPELQQPSRRLRSEAAVCWIGESTLETGNSQSQLGGEGVGGGPVFLETPPPSLVLLLAGAGSGEGREFSSLTAWWMKLFVSLVVRERRLLYLFPEGRRLNRLCAG